jgi:hypothetical protein
VASYQWLISLSFFSCSSCSTRYVPTRESTVLGEAMRVLALVVALLSVPAFATDYTPWPGQEREPAASSKWVELAQQPQKCCKHCSKGQPCGNTCIAATAKCKQPPGCAC